MFCSEPLLATPSPSCRTPLLTVACPSKFPLALVTTNVPGPAFTTLPEPLIA